MKEFVPPPDNGGFTGPPLMHRRFRAFLPVVIDVETGGIPAPSWHYAPR